MSEEQTISSADVATIRMGEDGEIKVEAKGPWLIPCSKCGNKVDKGAPPQKGQNDVHFTCEDCQGAHNVKETAKKLALEAPTEQLGVEDPVLESESKS